MRTKLRASGNYDNTSLVYGEIDFESFKEAIADALSHVQNKEKLTFFDLGSGTGKHAHLHIQITKELQKLEVGITIILSRQSGICGSK